MTGVAATNPRRARPRLTVRLRLTLLFGALFLGAGAVLLTLNYLLVQQSFNRNPDEVRAAIARRAGISEAELRRVFERPRDPAAIESPAPLPPLARTGRNVFEDVQAEINRSHLDRLLVQSLIALGVMGVVSVGLGWLVAGRVLQPVHEMTDAARRLSESNLSERISLSGPEDELKELADTFDAMLDRLEAAFESQRGFVADASHELRTPLSIIRTEVDVALAAIDASPEELRAMGETVREATARSEALIDSLLALATSDATVRGDDRCDLADLARAAVERVTREADALGLGLDLELESAPVVGDRMLLDRLVGNLVENAVRHNQRGGWLSVATHRTEHGVVLHIANGGARIEVDEVASLPRRFYSAGATRGRDRRGFGLGLSIVASVARAHGGTLELAARDDGGLDVTVELPDAPVGG